MSLDHAITRRIVIGIVTVMAVVMAGTAPVLADTTTSSTTSTSSTTQPPPPPPPPPPTTSTSSTTQPPPPPPPPPPTTSTSSTTQPSPPPPPPPPPASTTSSSSTTTTSSSSTTTSSTAPTTTQTTVSPAQLAALLSSLNADLAKAQAIDSFIQAKQAAAAIAAAAQAGQPASPAAAAAAKAADPGLLNVATNDLVSGAAKDAAQRQLDLARHRLARMGVALYVHEDTSGDTSSLNTNEGSSLDRSVLLPILLSQATTDVSSAKHTFDRAAAAYRAAKAQADQAVNARAAALAKAAEAAAQAAAVAAAAATTTTTTTTPSTTGPPASSGQTSSQTTTTSRPPATPVSSPYGSGGPTILGQAALTGPELTAWYQSTGHQANLTVPLDTLTAFYQSTGTNMNVRDDIAFAQSMIETGYLSFPSFGQVTPTDNNFAGIGACDSCSTGFHFADAQTGVAAQLQLLAADAHGGPAPPGPLPSPVGVSGCCPTWLALDGVWATGGGYGYHILMLYKQMLEWTLQRRQASAGL